MFRFLFKWSLQITGSALVGYHYFLKPDQQANLYGLYRSAGNSYRASKQIYAATRQYKTLLELENNSQQYQKKLDTINKETSKRIYKLSQQNKGVYMRLGQYLSHLKYTFPESFTKTLNKLNEDTQYASQDYKYLKKHIQNHLGKKTKELFQTLNTSPMHTNLFYQVYKGELLENYLDITLKVMHPYAQSEAEYDFKFLKKVVSYLETYKEKNFPKQQSFFLDLIYQNLKKEVEQELNFKEQEKASKSVREKIIEEKQNYRNKKIKSLQRRLQMYIPHRYSKYITEKVAIHEYFEGSTLNNLNKIETDFIPQNKISQVALDYVKSWNFVANNNNFLNESIQSDDVMIRKSRTTEVGPYQYCLLNFTRRHYIQQSMLETYSKLWKNHIQSLKLYKKKEKQRGQAVEKLYQQLPNLLFYSALKDEEIISNLKRHIDQSQRNKSVIEVEQYAKKQISKEFLATLTKQKKKQKQLQNMQEPQNYKALRKAFQIQYQPWKFQILLQNYKSIFGDSAISHFGLSEPLK